jgi:hypothetical protein
MSKELSIAALRQGSAARGKALNYRTCNNSRVPFRQLVRTRALGADDFVPVLRMARDGVSLAGPPGAALLPAEGVSLYTEAADLRPLDDIEADVIRHAIGHYRGRMTEVAGSWGSVVRRSTAN